MSTESNPKKKPLRIGLPGQRDFYPDALLRCCICGKQFHHSRFYAVLRNCDGIHDEESGMTDSYEKCTTAAHEDDCDCDCCVGCICEGCVCTDQCWDLATTRTKIQREIKFLQYLTTVMEQIQSERVRPLLVGEMVELVNRVNTKARLRAAETENVSF